MANSAFQKSSISTPVSVANGGTGAATLGDAGVLIGNGTGAVQVTSAGTSGQVLTSNGAGVDPTFQAAASSSTPTMKLSANYDTAGRYSVDSVLQTGAATYGTTGVTITTGATASATVRQSWNYQNSNNYSGYSGSPTVSIQMTTSGLGDANVGQVFVGIGSLALDATGHTFTQNHVGFKFIGGGATTSLYATQADGTTENASSALTTIAAADTLDLIFVINGSTSVAYYWRKNGGSLSSATTLTGNVPTTATSSSLVTLSASNLSTANTISFTSGGVSYQR